MRDPSNINISPKDAHGRCRVSGAMTLATASSALKQATALFRENRSLQFDFSDVDTADSAGAGLLVEWMRIAGVNGCEIEYSNLPDKLLAMIRVGGLQGMLPIGAGSTEPGYP